MHHFPYFAIYARNHLSFYFLFLFLVSLYDEMRRSILWLLQQLRGVHWCASMIRDDGLSPNFFLIYKRVCRILAINLFTFSFFLLETPYLEESIFPTIIEIGCSRILEVKLITLCTLAWRGRFVWSACAHEAGDPVPWSVPQGVFWRTTTLLWHKPRDTNSLFYRLWARFRRKKIDWIAAERAVLLPKHLDRAATGLRAGTRHDLMTLSCLMFLFTGQGCCLLFVFFFLRGFSLLETFEMETNI